jgi:hypothetical protein
MTRVPVSAPWPSRRRPQRSGTVAHLLPMLGIVEEADNGEWTAKSFGGTELGTYRHRAEATEALVVYGVFGA